MRAFLFISRLLWASTMIISIMSYTLSTEYIVEHSAKVAFPADTTKPIVVGTLG